MSAAKDARGRRRAAVLIQLFLGVAKAEIRVDKPYPRLRDDPELVRLRRDNLGLLGVETAWRSE